MLITKQTIRDYKQVRSYIDSLCDKTFEQMDESFKELTLSVQNKVLTSEDKRSTIAWIAVQLPEIRKTIISKLLDEDERSVNLF